MGSAFTLRSTTGDVASAGRAAAAAAGAVAAGVAAAGAVAPGGGALGAAWRGATAVQATRNPRAQGATHRAHPAPRVRVSISAPFGPPRPGPSAASLPARPRSAQSKQAAMSPVKGSGGGAGRPHPDGHVGREEASGGAPSGWTA